MADFQDLTADDFGEPSAKAKQFVDPYAPETPAQPAPRKMTAAEIEPSWLKRGLAGAGMTLTNKYRGLTGQEAAPGAELNEDTAGSIGGMLPDVIGSMAVPARIIPQALYGAATKAIEPASNALERAVAGLKGAGEFGGGQALASGAVRGINALGGNLTRTGEAAKAAKLAGLKLSAGDLTDSRLLRLMEEKSLGSPSAGQGEDIARIMNTDGGDPITVAVKTAYENANAKVADASSRLDSFISQNALPSVAPVKTVSALRDIIKHNPASLEAIDDVVLRDRLKILAGKNPNKAGLSFEELDDLRKAVGPVMANIKRQATSGSTNVTTNTANRWAGKDGLYASIMKDMEAWGASGKLPEEAMTAHKELSSAFKNEVLPLRDHPVAGKVLEGGYTRPEDLLRDLTSPRNKSIINDLYGRLDIAGKNAFDALRAAKRGSREFVKGEPSALTFPERAALYGSLATSPAWAPAAAGAAPWLAGALIGEQAVVHGINTPLGRAIASGSPRAAKNPLADAAIQAGLRTGLPRGALAAAEEVRR